MFGIVNALGGLVALATYIIKEVAAKWGYKVALVAAIVAVYTAAWVAIGAIMVGTFSLLPTSPFVSAVTQFFPSKTVMVSAASVYYGTMATLKSWDYFRLVAGVAAKIGS